MIGFLPLTSNVMFCSWLFVKIQLILKKAIPNLQLHISEKPFLLSLLSTKVLEEALDV